MKKYRIVRQEIFRNPGDNRVFYIVQEQKKVLGLKYWRTASQQICVDCYRDIEFLSIQEAREYIQKQIDWNSNSPVKLEVVEEIVENTEE